ncbi:tRNA-Val4 [Bacillus sonorensis]|uniref:Rhoptry protein n=3 Tax=Bacillota TaxID=1239 RepID=M5P5K4_9BACI|nr:MULTISPECIES: hypothetical protein [Bacillus]TWK72925.1 hypothetical protein CHCC20335_1590 [Bacillus paralicheniformis]ASB90058.1 hypothetical protein S101395_03551 [Bacillus sonorensis]EME74728.1 rhoptry protein [Bacillus sonorensis L12]MBG9916739.1 tRNA-Val4 [Bacillus sonorensis]MCY8025301.1 tRNA-Val4 [Bacillus sonorensis]
MKHFYQFEKDPFGDLRIILPKEINIFSDFIENIMTIDQADEYIDYLNKVLNGEYEDFEIQLNAASVSIKKDVTVVEHFYRNEPPYKNKIS